ncbi:hypothetical protein C9975_07685 [Thalassospira xiamenensis]|nr:hypothetical protein C9975_07685 [Thalassospira xiamenensis]
MEDILKEASRRLSLLTEDKRNLLLYAEKLVESHWQFNRVNQHRIKQKIQRGDKSEKPVSVAPYIKMKKGDFTRNKAYITWREWRHNPNARKGAMKSVITDLKPYERGYTNTFFIKHCQPWLVNHSIQTERYLEPIRAQLNAMHEHIIKQRKIVEKLTKQLETENG